jgi:putative transposase
MKRCRHTPEQVIRKLREADRLLAEGKDVDEVARHLEVSAETYHRWRNQFGVNADDAKKLKELERENGRLQKLLAEAELDATSGVSGRRPGAFHAAPRVGGSRR